MPTYTKEQVEARIELSKNQYQSGFNVIKENKAMSCSEIHFLPSISNEAYRYLHLIQGLTGIIDLTTLELETQEIVDLLPVICGFMAAQGMKYAHIWMGYVRNVIYPEFKTYVEFSKERPEQNLGAIFSLTQNEAFFGWDIADEYVYKCRLKRRVFEAVSDDILDEINRLVKTANDLTGFNADNASSDGEICRRFLKDSECRVLKLEHGVLSLHVNDVLKAVGADALRKYSF